jgi:hypothetical protein
VHMGLTPHVPFHAALAGWRFASEAPPTAGGSALWLLATRRAFAVLGEGYSASSVPHRGPPWRSAREDTTRTARSAGLAPPDSACIDAI